MNPRYRPVIVVIAAAAVAVLAVAVAALAGEGDVGPASRGSPLHQARVDAARRADVDALQVQLVALREAGFDGCLGVVDPNQACRDLFVGGYIAVFEAGAAEYRYHFGGDEWRGPVDPARASDGLPVPAEVKPDLVAILAEYARLEHALRRDSEPTGLVIEWIAPLTFDNACLGYRPAGKDCLQKGPLTRGALVRVAGAGPPTLYSVATIGVVYHDPRMGETLVQPVAEHTSVQANMRADLAKRLGVDTGRVSMGSFRLVTWSDGCLGVYQSGSSCTLTTVEGFLALVTNSGLSYRYHGGGTKFIPAAFEKEAQVRDPIQR